MAWSIEFSDDAEKDFSRLDNSIQRRIYSYLHGRIAVAIDPRDFGKPLVHELSGLWRFRVGDYRILCRIEDDALTILVLEIGHRSSVYDR